MAKKKSPEEEKERKSERYKDRAKRKKVNNYLRDVTPDNADYYDSLDEIYE